MRIVTFLLTTLLLCYFNYANAQGCSDAGFCSAGVLQSGGIHTDSNIRSTPVGIAFTVGGGEQGTTISIVQLEAGIHLGKKGMLDISAPYVFVNGGLGTHSGIGDPIITYSRNAFTRETWNSSLTTGFRISTGDASADENGIALPMPYQPNLGTTDFIVGMNATYRKWLSFAIGCQQPIIQYNNNAFITPTYATANENEYFSSFRLRRKGDALLRMETHYIKKSWSASFGTLFIYHLGKDKITLQNGDEVMLNNSDGLTLNLTASVKYQLRKVMANLQFGTPFIVRTYRPDGLTRSWVVTLRITTFTR